jgi:hypothetical protein
MTIDTQLSNELAKAIQSKRALCWWNAAFSVLRIENTLYVIGYILVKQSNRLYPHAWVEMNNSIVDPTLVLDDRLTDYRFFPVLRFDRSTMAKEILRNGGHPGLHNLPQYAEKMLSIRDEIKEILGNNVRFWGER